MQQRLPVLTRDRTQDQFLVTLVAGGLGCGGPDRVQDGKVVGTGQAVLSDRGSGQLGAVAAQDVGEHRDRLALIGPARAAGRELAGVASGAFPADALAAAKFGGGPGAGGRVGGSGRAVNANARLVSVPQVIAGYSHWRSSLPVTTAIPVCTVAP